MGTGLFRNMMGMRTLAVLLLASLATLVSAQKCVFKFEALPPKGTTCASLKTIEQLDKDVKAIKDKKMVAEIAPAMKKLGDAVKRRVKVEKELAEQIGKVQKMTDDMAKLDKAAAAAAKKPAAGATGATPGAKPGSKPGAKPGPATPAKPVDPGDDKDCAGLKLKDKTKGTAEYDIKPAGQPIKVYCNMDMGEQDELKGWAVILRRTQFVDFNKKFAEYERGFGNRGLDHWIGLQNLQKITAQDEWQLYVSLKDHDKNEAFARYSKFKVSGPPDYKLTIDGYDPRSTAGNGLSDSNGIGFSANDKDNDGSKLAECGKQYQSGWWFNQYCPNPANLNGIWHKKASPYDSRGIIWREWRQNENLKEAVMYIQRKRSPPKPTAG
ncbi:fibrinogen-like protein 1 [Branchiostoma lanceolatum]|uniref:fibrinogen-like protein 1 n=1 Tax=Branchiostoma lanceolatum TaxID=7740 RepID=UPI003455F97D